MNQLRFNIESTLFQRCMPARNISLQTEPTDVEQLQQKYRRVANSQVGDGGDSVL